MRNEAAVKRKADREGAARKAAADKKDDEDQKAEHMREERQA
jgi:hypothetical protein